MAKISSKRRKFEIQKKKKRKEKLKKLKAKYFATTNAQEKNKIVEKIKKIAPLLDWEQKKNFNL